MVRLSTLKTATFNDMDKDAAQTEHARNWMEVGPESSDAARMKHEWALFDIKSVEAGDAKEENGARVSEGEDRRRPHDSRRHVREDGRLHEEAFAGADVSARAARDERGAFLLRGLDVAEHALELGL